MNAFQRKPISPTKRICLRLKEARETAGFSLDELSHKTKIDKRHLEALENCKFDELPDGPVYHKHFIRTYLKAIGAHPDSYLRQYILEEGPQREKAQAHPHKVIGRQAFQNLPGILTALISVAIIGLLLTYLGLQVRRILEPPPLTVETPAQGFITNDPSVTITGSTDPETQVTVNGQSITTNEQGQFESTVDLTVGVNTFIITAIQKHGKATEETRHVVLREANP